MLGEMNPIAFVHENTAAAVYFAVNSQINDPEYDKNILFINLGSSGSKLSLIRVHSVKEKESFYPQVESLHDKFYSEFSGH